MSLSRVELHLRTRLTLTDIQIEANYNEIAARMPSASLRSVLDSYFSEVVLALSRVIRPLFTYAPLPN